MEKKTSVKENIGARVESSRRRRLSLSRWPRRPRRRARGVGGKTRVRDFFLVGRVFAAAEPPQPLDSRRGYGDFDRDFASGTLDPDFVAFNSNNRRYHYPARALAPFRGVFLSKDPLLQVMPSRSIPRRGYPLLVYAYGISNPSYYADPRGWNPVQMCEDAKEKIQKEMASTMSSFLVDCDVDIKCKDCCTKDDLTDWTADAETKPRLWFSANMVVCTDNFSKRVPNFAAQDIEDLIRHEMTHAYDHCFGVWMGDQNCEDKVCTEIRGAAFGGECKAGHFGNRQGNLSLEECATTVAEGSTDKACHYAIPIVLAKCLEGVGPNLPRWPNLKPNWDVPKNMGRNEGWKPGTDFNPSGEPNRR